MDKLLSFLHDLDIEICRYIRVNIAAHLDPSHRKKSIRKKAKPIGSEREPEAIKKTSKSKKGKAKEPPKHLPHLDWMARYEEGTPKAKFTHWLVDKADQRTLDYLFDGERERAVLNEAELYDLAWWVEEFTDQFAKLQWSSEPAPHSLICQALIMIAKQPGSACRNTFDIRTAEFQKLEHGARDLATGIHLAIDAILEIRMLIRTADRLDLLPMPFGLIPTPTCRSAKEKPEPPAILEPYVSRMRKQIDVLGPGASAERLIDGQGKKQSCLDALKWLELTGEYLGRRRSRRNNSGGRGVT